MKAYLYNPLSLFLSFSIRLSIWLMKPKERITKVRETEKELKSVKTFLLRIKHRYRVLKTERMENSFLLKPQSEEIIKEFLSQNIKKQLCV